MNKEWASEASPTPCILYINSIDIYNIQVYINCAYTPKSILLKNKNSKLANRRRVKLRRGQYQIKHTFACDNLHSCST